jgi:hypothetical protein
MTRTFVAIGDPVHDLLRNVTRHVPLCPSLAAGDLPVFEYRFRIEDLPEDYYTLAAFHSLKGLPLGHVRLCRRRVAANDKLAIAREANYFDAVKLDRRCCRDLRMRFQKNGPGMLAGELLAYGTGMLRARNDDPVEPAHRLLWERHGRISSPHEVVYSRIWALHWNSLPLLYRTQKESYDSTNVIYGDAFGELEQLWDRRADTVFLDQVAASLQRMRSQAETAAFLDPPLNLAAMMKLHRRCQQLWKTPPCSARSLLRRVECILEHTTVDHEARTVFRGWESELQPPPRPEPPLPEPETTQWKADGSGYDGWLDGDNGS